MSENLMLQIAVLLKNTVCIIAFILLAIVFNKWWIALFAVLFLTTVEKEENKDGSDNK